MQGEGKGTAKKVIQNNHLSVSRVCIHREFR
jgi:hypothetical protein